MTQASELPALRIISRKFEREDFYEFKQGQDDRKRKRQREATPKRASPGQRKTKAKDAEAVFQNIHG